MQYPFGEVFNLWKPFYTRAPNNGGIYFFRYTASFSYVNY